jgi:hypothetical protein
MSKDAKAHLAELHALPCVVCKYLHAKPQTSHTVAHHLESVRDANSDYAAVSICDECHRLLHHMSRRGFERFTKLTEIDLLALTIRAMREA